MITLEERKHFDEQGYLHVRGVLDPDLLAKVQEAFEPIWHDNKGKKNQHVLLRHKLFIDLIEHPPIYDRQRAVFKSRIQLLQYDFLRQEPNDHFPLRGWHRDLSFPGDHCLSINTIVYLDHMDDATGPTYVVPGTHRGTELPPKDKKNEPLEGEVAVHADAGDAVFINSAIWHSGSRNQSDHLRRGIYMYYGQHWMKRYETDVALPWQAFENASETRLQLLGVKCPPGMHIYDPDLP